MFARPLYALASAILWLHAIADPSCHDYVIIATRGTGEIQGPSIAFTNMTAETLKNVPNGIVYNTVYPASQANNSLTDGVKDIGQYIDNGLKDCPDQKYALLGYSQGATVTAMALHNYTNMNSASAKAIAGVLLVGNPAHKPYQAANYDEKGGLTTNGFTGILYETVARVPTVWYQSTRLIDICYFNDFVCNGPVPSAVKSGWKYHLKYGSTSEVQDIGEAFLRANLLPEIMT